MWAKFVAAVCGCIVGLAGGLDMQAPSQLSKMMATAPIRAAQEIVAVRIAFPAALADSKRRKRTRERREAERKAEEKRFEEAEKQYIGIRRTTLPSDCVYDSNASAFNGTDLYICGGMYFERYEENGVAVYEGHPVDLDREEIKRARARRTEAEKKQKQEARKKLEAARRPSLPLDCGYDSYTSMSMGADVYVCQGVRYRQYEEKGVTGYEVVKP